MSMFDMMFNEEEKRKMMEGFETVLSKAVAEGIEAKLAIIIPAVEQAVERVLVKHGVIGSLDDVIKQTVSELQETPLRQITDAALKPQVCTCGADRTGPSAEAHLDTCPAK